MSKNNRKQTRGAGRPLLCLLLVLSLGGAGVLGYLAYDEYRDRKEGEDFYQSLLTENYEAKPTQAAPTEATATPDVSAEATATPDVSAEATATPDVSAEATATPDVSAEATATPDVSAEATATPDVSAEATAAPHPTDAAPQETAEPILPAYEVVATPEPAVRPSALNFDALRMDFPDIVGWLRLDDTIINYPVVQGTDNDFYIKHLPNGKPKKCGSIMMDVSNNGLFTNDVTILHGHHMRNGSMFGSLDSFRKEEYYQQHSTFQLMTPRGDYEVAVVAAYVVNSRTFGFINTFADESEFEVFMQEAISNTPYVTGVEVTYGDRLLVLSTCDYTYSGARYIVLGKLIEAD